MRMHRLSIGTMVALASVAALILGGCASAGFEHRLSGDGSAYSASPYTGPAGPEERLEEATQAP
jgi:hypothetical protein